MSNQRNLRPIPPEKRGKGGKRKGAGRKPDWFKAKMVEIGTSQKAIKFLQSVINGEPVEEKKILVIGQEPITVWESASVDARVRAWNAVMDRGLGKPSQALEVGGVGGGPLTIQLVHYGDK